jgi:hypothetical protein
MRIGKGSISIDGQKDDGLVRILAEPNIMAISGQQASFLSGGKIFIPVAQTNTNGVPVMTLEEKSSASASSSRPPCSATRASTSSWCPRCPICRRPARPSPPSTASPPSSLAHGAARGHHGAAQ